MITHAPVIGGSIDISVTLRALNDDGTPMTTIAFDSTGLDLKYQRTRSAITDITEVTLASVSTAHTDGGVKHLGAGYFRLDLPDAAVGLGVREVIVFGTVTGGTIIGAYVPIIAGAFNVPTVHVGAMALSQLTGEGTESDPIEPV